jgi:enamine deaminase RidA (YjgF/YER057c/UK114 family)
MGIPKRHWAAIMLGGLALLGPWTATGQAQFRPPIINPALAMNPYVNPLAAQSLFMGQALQARSALATAGFSHPFAALAGAGYGFNLGTRYGSMIGLNYGANMMSPYAQLGYASLMNNAYGGMGGFGPSYGVGASLYGSALSNAAAGYGFGYGYGMMNTQWMMNPYQGYLQGAADVTRANAEYYRTIQQAKLTREEARRSYLQTRRAAIEEAAWEREQMPDPEKLRQQTLERELTHARFHPPLTDIWTARSLNALLRNFITLQADGVKAPTVPLNEDIVKHINVSASSAHGSVGLLKNNGGDLEWPEPLNRSMFKENREKIDRLMKSTYNTLRSNNPPVDATVADLQDAYEKMCDTLKGQVNDPNFSSDDYFEAKRYLEEMKDTLKALKDPAVTNHFNDNWELKAKNVAELVQFMSKKGLQFAPATDKDLSAYVSLYNAMASYDSGLPRLATSSSSSGLDK